MKKFSKICPNGEFVQPVGHSLWFQLWNFGPKFCPKLAAYGIQHCLVGENMGTPDTSLHQKHHLHKDH